MDGQDHYDVLGVRPNAGHEEIELAYKGRRSQYHPDRYANADAETQAWATRKMQQVNEAYSVLTDTSARAAHDCKSQSKEQPSAQPKEEAAPHSGPPPMPPQTERRRAQGGLAELVMQNELQIVSDKIHIAPNIPPRKIDGALQSYGRGLSPKDIIVLVDSTVFGSAKDGALVTSRDIRCRENPFSEIGIYKFSEINRVQCEKQTLYINGRKACWLNISDQYALNQLAECLNRFVNAETGSVEADAGHRESAGQAPKNPSGLEISNELSRVKNDAIYSLIQDLTQSGMGILDLIQHIHDAMWKRFSQLHQRAQAVALHSKKSVKDETFEASSIIFAALYGHCFSMFPQVLRDEIGDHFTQLLEPGMEFLERSLNIYNAHTRATAASDVENLQMTILMFAQDDRGWLESQMKLPRAEAILQALQEGGYDRGTAIQIVGESANAFQKWFVKQAS